MKVKEKFEFVRILERQKEDKTMNDRGAKEKEKKKHSPAQKRHTQEPMY